MYRSVGGRVLVSGVEGGGLSTGGVGKRFSRGLDICPECGGRVVADRERGELVCPRCGLVLEACMMDPGPEWRSFTPEERVNRKRNGPPITYAFHDKGLSTSMRVDGWDASGRRLPAEARRRVLRLRLWQLRSRTRGSAERNLCQAVGEMGRLADNLNLPTPVLEEAAVIYRKALRRGLVRGRSIAAVAAAALYAACRLTGIPRTLRELAEASVAGRRDIARCYRLLVERLGLRMPIDDPVKCVPKIASKVGIGERCQQIAIDMLRKAQEAKAAAGKSPMGLAAAALYLACIQAGEPVTQREIANVAQVTEVTIRNRTSELKRVLGAWAARI